MPEVVLRHDLPKTSFEVPTPMGLLEDLDEPGGEMHDPEAGRDSEVFKVCRLQTQLLCLSGSSPAETSPHAEV